MLWLLKLLVYTCISSVYCMEPCCTSNKFETVLAEAGGIYVSNTTTVPIDVWNEMYYDYDRKMMALETHTRLPGGQYKLITVIMDFRQQLEFAIDGDNCTVIQVKEGMQRPCIPNTALYLGTSSIGYGEEVIKFTSWEFKTPESDVSTKLTVTAKDCVPLTQSMYGTVRGYKTAVSYTYANFKPRITDDSVFDVPSKCQQVYSHVHDTKLAGRTALDGIKAIFT